jgi:spore maturation protein CgeB
MNTINQRYLSKIIINFPYHALGFSQLKSRVLEAMASGSLVFELKNESTSQLFEANQDFVEYQSLDDAVEKYVYYINNLEEMKRIAKNGYIKYLNHYSGKCFWKKIFENI